MAFKLSRSQGNREGPDKYHPSAFSFRAAAMSSSVQPCNRWWPD